MIGPVGKQEFYKGVNGNSIDEVYNDRTDR